MSSAIAGRARIAEAPRRGPRTLGGATTGSDRGGVTAGTLRPDVASEAAAPPRNRAGDDGRGATFDDLPYGERMRDLLGPLHRGFGVVNRWLVLPALRAGLGPLFSTPVAGSLMILRTTGRSSGLRREAPLGYVILDGAVYCCAGFGERTAWYRNLLADRRVEVVLPTAAFAGIAETVVDEAEWSRAFPAYLRALGVLGRATLGDVANASPERLHRLRTELPLVRIVPTGIAPGPADPGGGLWVVVQIGWLVALGALVRTALHRLRPRRGAVAQRVSSRSARL